MSGRRLSAAAFILGLAIVVLAQRQTSIAGPPLYDGVVVIDPYAWLSPPPGLQGGAASAEDTQPVPADQSGGVAIATPEQPSQVQLIADYGSLSMPRGTTSIAMSITPVAVPSAQPPNGIVAGNVYRLSMTNQSGAAIGAKTGGSVTLVMRGPPSLPEATIEQFSDGAWRELQTQPAGIPDTFTADIPGFGEFALVAPYAWIPDGEGVAPSTPGGSSAPAVPGGSSAPADSTGPTTPAQGSGSAGLPLVPIAVMALAFLVLVGSMIVLWLLGRPPKPGASS